MKRIITYSMLMCVAIMLNAQMPKLEKLPITTLELDTLPSVEITQSLAEKLLGESALGLVETDKPNWNFCGFEKEPSSDYYVRFYSYGCYEEDNQSYYIIGKKSIAKDNESYFEEEFFLVKENHEKIRSVLISRSLYGRPQQAVFAITDNGCLYVMFITKEGYIDQEMYDLTTLSEISKGL